MTKVEMDMLEKCFEAEVAGSVFVTKSRVAHRLENRGLIQKHRVLICKDRFGSVYNHGYVTTILGNFTYCTSERCVTAPEEF